MGISEDLKLALMECFNQAAIGRIDPETKENAIELESGELGNIDIFDLCAEIGIVDEDSILQQIEQQTGQVMTSIPDAIKEQIVVGNQLSAVQGIEDIFEQKRQFAEAQKQIENIADDVANRLANLEPS